MDHDSNDEDVSSAGKKREGRDATSSAVSSVDDLVERLRSRVRERRSNGEYPDGLEEALDAHFRRIVFHRSRPHLGQLREAVATFDERLAARPRDVGADSGVPGGEMLHRVVNKAIARQRQALVDHMSDLADAMRDVVHVLVDAVQDPANHVHGDLVSRLDAILERLDSYERRPVEDAAAVGDLRRRVEVLEQALASQQASSRQASSRQASSQQASPG